MHIGGTWLEAIKMHGTSRMKSFLFQCKLCSGPVFLAREVGSSLFPKLCVSPQALLAIEFWFSLFFNQLITFSGIFSALKRVARWQSSLLQYLYLFFGNQWEEEKTWDLLQGNRERLVYQISHFWQTAGCSFNNELPIIGMCLIQVNTHALNLLIGNFSL